MENLNLSNLTTTQGLSIINGNSIKRISAAGDVNGDGYDDIIIEAVDYSYESVKYLCYVVYGNFTNPENIDLTKLENRGFTITGGTTAAGAGDVNGDGYDDIIIGSPHRNYVVYYGSSGSVYYTHLGVSYLIYGKSSLTNIDTSSLTSAQGVIIKGGRNCGSCYNDKNAGYYVSKTGDTNGDGYDDIMISTPNIGTLSIVYGGTNLTSLNLASLTTKQGFTITGVGMTYDSGYSSYPWTFSNIGDVNNDTKADILANDGKKLYVIFGGLNLSSISITQLTAEQGFTISGGDYGMTSLGYSMSYVGDMNGDKIDDIVIGAPITAQLNDYYYPEYNNYKGIVYVLYGSPQPVNIDLYKLTPAQGFSIVAANYTDMFGYSVSNAGDINGDGFADIVLGAPKADVNTIIGTLTSAGKSYIIYGKEKLENLDLAHLSSSSGFYLSSSSSRSVGTIVKEIGDFNKDGYDDFIIGSSSTTYVVFGSKVSTNSLPTTSPTPAPATLPAQHPIQNHPTLSPTKKPHHQPWWKKFKNLVNENSELEESNDIPNSSHAKGTNFNLRGSNFQTEDDGAPALFHEANHDSALQIIGEINS